MELESGGWCHGGGYDDLDVGMTGEGHFAKNLFFGSKNLEGMLRGIIYQRKFYLNLCWCILWIQTDIQIYFTPEKLTKNSIFFIFQQKNQKTLQKHIANACAISTKFTDTIANLNNQIVITNVPIIRR